MISMIWLSVWWHLVQWELDMWSPAGGISTGGHLPPGHLHLKQVIWAPFTHWKSRSATPPLFLGGVELAYKKQNDYSKQVWWHNTLTRCSVLSARSWVQFHHWVSGVHTPLRSLAMRTPDLPKRYQWASFSTALVPSSTQYETGSLHLRGKNVWMYCRR